MNSSVKCLGCLGSLIYGPPVSRAPPGTVHISVANPELKEDLRAVFRAADGSEAAELLDDWMHRAAYCKIAKVVAVEKKVRRRRDDIIAAVELGISNGRVEAINNKIKVTVRMGYGFRNTDNLVALLMLRCGDCQPQLPGRPVKARKKGVKGAKSVAA